MAGNPFAVVMRHLYKQTARYEGNCVSDAQLLERYVERRDESAFELLLWRHGAMVWGVCHRVLRDHHDAEDAFQAAWLTLARKAGSICRPSAPASTTPLERHPRHRDGRATPDDIRPKPSPRVARATARTPTRPAFRRTAPATAHRIRNYLHTGPFVYTSVALRRQRDCLPWQTFSSRKAYSPL